MKVEHKLENGKLKHLILGKGAKELKLSRDLQTDTAVILMTYGKLKAKGWDDNKIIEKIIDGLLSIGFDKEYWQKKVKEVLKTHGITIRKAMDTGTAGEGHEWKSEGYSKVKIYKVKLSDMKELKKAKFLLRRHWWRGAMIVRGMSVDHWDLVVDKGEKCLDEFAGMMNNPLEEPEGVNCIRQDYCTGTPEGKPNKEWMNFFGEIPPNHPEWGNPNKRIPAYMDKVDSGSVNIASDTSDFVSFMFHGKELKGYWIAKRESPRSENWVFSKSALPGEPRKEIKQVENKHKDCANFNPSENKCNLKNKSVDPEGSACPDFVPKTNLKRGFGQGRGGGQRRSWNAPTFAFITAWGKEPKEFLRGRTDAPKKIWHGLDVDANLKDRWLEDLNSIPDIEIRSSDAGKSKERVAFVIIRFTDKKNDNKAKKLVKILSKQEGIYSKTDVGTEGRNRICVAGKIWYSKEKEEQWEKWWDTLAEKIKNSVNEILKKD